MKYMKHMKHMKHWQDAANAVLGAWLVVSPWVLGFQRVPAALLITIAIGVLLVASSAGAMSFAQAWEEWLDALLGTSLLLSPALLGFTGQPAALRNAVAVGAVVTVLAIWVLVTDEDFASIWRRPQG